MMIDGPNRLVYLRNPRHSITGKYSYGISEVSDEISFHHIKPSFHSFIILFILFIHLCLYSMMMDIINLVILSVCLV